jgi:hypothetical protein
LAAQESKANPKPLGDGMFGAEIPIDARLVLTDGTRLLQCDPTFVTNLCGPRNIDTYLKNLPLIITPWGLGGMGKTINSNPARWILDAQIGSTKVTPRFVGDRTVDGTRLQLVEITQPSGTRTEYYFDPKRGYLPTQINRVGAKGDRRFLRVTDIRKCSHDRWFPMQMFAVRTRADASIERVESIEVTVLDVDVRPKTKDLSVLLPRGLSVNHVDDLRSQFRLQADERFGVEDLEKLHARCLKVLEEKTRAAGSRRKMHKQN